MADVSRILILQTVIAPYRLPLFESIDDEVETDVWFCEGLPDGRRWTPDPDEYDFQSRVLKHFEIGSFLVNYTVPIALVRNDFDAFVIGEDPRSLFAALLILLYAKLTGVPLIVWSGGIETEHRDRTRETDCTSRILRSIYHLYRRILYSSANSFVGYSHRTREFLSNRSVDSDNVFIGGQVTPEEILPAPTSTRTNENPIVLFLGYLYERKGVDDLIRAFERAETGDAELVIAGDGPKKEELEAMASSNDNVSFVGYVEGSDKADQFNRADLFVQPTHHDPSSHVLNEAMFYGVPIITTSADGGVEKIDGNGIVVEPSDHEEIASAIESLLNDEARRESFASQSEKLSKKYTSVEWGREPFLEALKAATE